jgi:hypothetical protein
MTNDEGTTVGVYIGPDDEDLLQEFDDLAGSRSRNLRRAMMLLVKVESAFSRADIDLSDWSERRLGATVLQAVVDHLRDEGML